MLKRRIDLASNVLIVFSDVIFETKLCAIILIVILFNLNLKYFMNIKATISLFD